jgi:hypothetical protein
LPLPNDGGGWNFADFSGISRIHISLRVRGGQIVPWGVMRSALGSGAVARKLAGITDEKAASSLPASLQISLCLADTNKAVVFKRAATD